MCFIIRSLEKLLMNAYCIFSACDFLYKLEKSLFFYPQQNVTQPVDMEVSV